MIQMKLEDHLQRTARLRKLAFRVMETTECNHSGNTDPGKPDLCLHCAAHRALLDSALGMSDPAKLHYSYWMEKQLDVLDSMTKDIIKTLGGGVVTGHEAEVGLFISHVKALMEQRQKNLEAYDGLDT